MMSSDPATSTASAENELSVGVDAAAPTIPVLPVAEQERMVQTNDQESLANCDTPLEAASPSSSGKPRGGIDRVIIAPVVCTLHYGGLDPLSVKQP